MMRSAADFLPLFMMTFMNLASMSLLNFGSGRIVRTGAAERRDISNYPLLLRPLRAVLRTRLLTVVDASGIQCAAYRVIANAREVLHAAAADQNNRVLLEVVAFTADVAGDFVTVGQTDTADLPESRVRLLRGRGVHAGTHAAFLRGCAKSRNFCLFRRGPARVPDKLTSGRHTEILSKILRRAFSLVRRPGRLERRPGVEVAAFDPACSTGWIDKGRRF